MTNGELIEILSAYPLDMQVIVSKDSDATEMSPLTDISEKGYIAESDVFGYLADEIDESENTLYPTNYDDEEEYDETYRSRYTGATRVIVLFPLS